MGFFEDLGNYLGVSQVNPATNQYGQPASTLTQVDYQQMLNNALAQQSSNYANQNALAGTLQSEVNGGGPNLAQQQLEHATNQSIQQQAGAVAGLRGLNPAQMARLISQNSVAAQQQMVGQSAEARMQQQLAAQSQLAGVLGQQGQQNIAQSGQAAQGNAQQNATNLQNVQGTNTLNAQIAQGNSQAAAGAVNGAAGAIPTIATLALAHGGEVGGTPRVAGDSHANDTQPAMLAPHEKVIPASIAHDPLASAAFVAHVDHMMKRRRARA